eukprot:Rhum_TRINITY_DN14584_c35_g1::Rhum_TRINITY_DN14584_c35_g1_i1::g.100149::m.100149
MLGQRGERDMEEEKVGRPGQRRKRQEALRRRQCYGDLRDGGNDFRDSLRSGVAEDVGDEEDVDEGLPRHDGEQQRLGACEDVIRVRILEVLHQLCPHQEAAAADEPAEWHHPELRRHQHSRQQAEADTDVFVAAHAHRVEKPDLGRSAKGHREDLQRGNLQHAHADAPRGLRAEHLRGEGVVRTHDGRREQHVRHKRERGDVHVHPVHVAGRVLVPVLLVVSDGLARRPTAVVCAERKRDDLQLAQHVVVRHPEVDLQEAEPRLVLPVAIAQLLLVQTAHHLCNLAVSHKLTGHPDRVDRLVPVRTVAPLVTTTTTTTPKRRLRRLRLRRLRCLLVEARRLLRCAGVSIRVGTTAEGLRRRLVLVLLVVVLRRRRLRRGWL